MGERRSCVTGKRKSEIEKSEERKRARGRRPPVNYPDTAWPRTIRRSSPRRNEWSKVSDINIFLIIAIVNDIVVYIRCQLGFVRTCQCTRDLNLCVRVHGPAASSFPATSVGTSVYSRISQLAFVFLPIVLLVLLGWILSIYVTIILILQTKCRIVMFRKRMRNK